jgi:hypothetical protein
MSSAAWILAPVAVVLILAAVVHVRDVRAERRAGEAHDAARMAEAGIDWKRTAPEVTYDERWTR